MRLSGEFGGWGGFVSLFLASLAPTLADAMKSASVTAFVLLDGTLLPMDRVAADRPFYSGSTRSTA